MAPLSSIEATHTHKYTPTHTHAHPHTHTQTPAFTPFFSNFNFLSTSFFFACLFVFFFLWFRCSTKSLESCFVGQILIFNSCFFFNLCRFRTKSFETCVTTSTRKLAADRAACVFVYVCVRQLVCVCVCVCVSCGRQRGQVPGGIVR
jgi:hypothetical protein